ncbi:hypothetical protein RYX36_014358, partial [Vicia faba]
MEFLEEQISKFINKSRFQVAGKEFVSEAEAHAFYNAHATRVGFVIHVSKLSQITRFSTVGIVFFCPIL